MRFVKLLKQESSLIIKFILSPIIGALLVGYVFSNPFIENIPFGVVDNDNSTLSRTIVEQLKMHPGLKVNYYSDSEYELEEAIKNKKINGGIIIPKNFGKDVSLTKSPSALILIDGTNMVIAGNALGYSSAVLGTLNAGVQMRVFEGRNMLPYVTNQTISSFSYVNRVLYDPQSSYFRNLMYTIIPFSVQALFLMQFLVPLLIEKKKELSSIKIRSKAGMAAILDIVAKVLIISTVSVISTFIALCILKKLYSLPLRGDILIYIVLMYLLLINLTAVGLIFASIVDNCGYFMMFYNMANLVIMLTCGVTYAQYMMPSGMPQIIKNIWPFLNVAVPLKFLNLKGVGWDIILPYIKDGLKYTLFWMPVGIALFSAKIVLLKTKKKLLLKSNTSKINEAQSDKELVI